MAIEAAYALPLSSIVLDEFLFGFFFLVFNICCIFVANWFCRASYGSLLNMNSETAKKF